MRTTTPLNGKDVISAAVNPCYSWRMFPDDTNLNPKVNGEIQGRAGVMMWDISNPTAPQLLSDVQVNRDQTSLERRKIVLKAGGKVDPSVTYNVNVIKDIEADDKTFAETTNDFGAWAFQSPDDVGIRTNYFSQDGKDYMVFNTLTADTGLVFYDITNPSSPV